ncbi:hypothetical protein QVD17_16864 [Tagetes erecta]|uniref:Secreted protein n=1 Tax=Tagetes erecta TaxID=13708 RepID=A0AAD8KXB8_TARER|nr:hypothetical protein QVD17_16864 [Tagetes erecta]
MLSFGILLSLLHFVAGLKQTNIGSCIFILWLRALLVPKKNYATYLDPNGKVSLRFLQRRHLRLITLLTLVLKVVMSL